MAIADRLTTTLSAKGRITLPKAIRQKRRWGQGTRLVVEDTGDGVLIRSAALFKPTRVEDVFGCLAYAGPAKTLKDMDAGISAEVKQKWAPNTEQ